MPVLIDTVAWVRVENGLVLCARPRGKEIFYIPGGKREGAESDLQTLLREISEELAVTLIPETVRPSGTYEAEQPGAHPDGAVVRMSCYTGDYRGTLAPSSEIDEFDWFSYADRPRVPLVDQLLFDDLKAAGQLRLRRGSGHGGHGTYRQGQRGRKSSNSSLTSSGASSCIQ